MAKDVFRIPVHKKFLPKHNCSVYQIRLTLELRTRTGAFVGMPFRFDTGMHHGRARVKWRDES